MVAVYSTYSCFALCGVFVGFLVYVCLYLPVCLFVVSFVVSCPAVLTRCPEGSSLTC
eukprot:m.21781 g.21781  ORF g.21781 m.21781 type:complete len:57 (-) comp8334_c0_seq1:2275-2445(-)